MALVPNISLTRLKKAWEAKQASDGFTVSEVIAPTYEMRDMAHLDRTIQRNQLFATMTAESLLTIPDGEVHMVLAMAFNTDLLDADQSLTGNLGYLDNANFLNPLAGTVIAPGDTVWAEGIVFNTPLPMLPGYRIGFINGGIVGGAIGNILATLSYLHYVISF